MIIEDCRSEAFKKFVYLKVGDCFEFNDEVYIKTDISDQPRNALSLTSNTTAHFIKQDIVIPINAKVVIE